MLEASYDTEGSAFITLTYSDEKVPTGPKEVPTLEPYHLRDFVKRIRKAFEPRRLRFHAVGEYGDLSGRPHYHVTLFGCGSCRKKLEVLTRPGEKIRMVCRCGLCTAVEKAWGYGHVHIGDVTAASAMYVSSYVTKKMTHALDPRLGGRHPEFARMSLGTRGNGGIGANAVRAIATAIPSNWLIPGGLRHGTRVAPLGRYLRTRIAEDITDGSKEAVRAKMGSEKALQENLYRMRVVRAYAVRTGKKPSEVIKEILSIPVVIPRALQKI